MALNITIIGLDAIGGSLGLALGTLDREALPTGRPTITGWDDDRRALKDARGRLMIDREARDVTDAVRDADVVFVCVPATAQADVFRAIAPHLKHGAVVTDVADTKEQTIAAAQEYLPATVDFIGGHPLLNLGAKPSASLDLFKNAIYCLVAGLSARPNALDLLAALVQAIGAKPYYIDAAEHDAYIAGVQHLPLVVATAVMETISRSGGWREMQPIAGVPFGRITQLVAADPEHSIAAMQTNSAAVERWINDLIRTLVELRDQLGDREQLEARFRHARDTHEQWLNLQPNMRPGEQDFYGQTEEIDRSLGALFFGQRRKKDDRGRR